MYDFIDNPAPDTTAENIIIKNKFAQPDKGQMLVELGLNKYVSNVDGSVVNAEWTETASFLLSGFQIPSNTAVDSVIGLVGVDGFKASDAQAHEADIKQAIIESEAITNTAYGAELEPGDITLTFDTSTARSFS